MCWCSLVFYTNTRISRFLGSDDHVSENLTGSEEFRPTWRTTVNQNSVQSLFLHAPNLLQVFMSFSQDGFYGAVVILQPPPGDVLGVLMQPGVHVQMEECGLIKAAESRNDAFLLSEVKQEEKEEIPPDLHEKKKTFSLCRT